MGAMALVVLCRSAKSGKGSGSDRLQILMIEIQPRVCNGNTDAFTSQSKSSRLGANTDYSLRNDLRGSGSAGFGWFSMTHHNAIRCDAGHLGISLQLLQLTWRHK